MILFQFPSSICSFMLESFLRLWSWILLFPLKKLWHTMPSKLGILRMNFLCSQKCPYEIFLPTPHMWLQNTYIKDKFLASGILYTEAVNIKDKFLASGILYTEAVTLSCSVRKVFLEILQNSQGNTCARVSSLIKLQAESCNFIKKETVAQVFSVNFAKLVGTPFLTEDLRRLLLYTAIVHLKLDKSNRASFRLPLHRTALKPSNILHVQYHTIWNRKVVPIFKKFWLNIVSPRRGLEV